MKKLFVLEILCVAFATAFGQNKTIQPTNQRKPLSHTVYDSWKEILFKSISTDGSIAAFTVNSEDGDGKAIFYHLKKNVQDSVQRATEVQITFDSKQVIFRVKPPQKLVKDLRRQKKKKEELPKDSLGIYTVDNRKTEKIPDLKSFKLPEKAGGWLAYQVESPKETEPKDDDKKSDKPKKKKTNTEDNGYTLVVRNLNTGKELSFPFVRDYFFAKQAQGLLFSSTGNDSTMKAGVYWCDLKNEKVQNLLESNSKYKFKGLSISEDGTQVAFLADMDTTKAQVRYLKLFHWKAGDTEASLIADEKKTGLPADWLISEASPFFSKNGSRLFFGSAPKPLVQDTTLLPEEIVNVEIWGWQDDYIYPMQNKQLETEKKRSYLFALDLNSQKVTQVGSKEIPSIEVGEEGNSEYALGQSNLPYRRRIVYDLSTFNDFYLINVNNGTRKNIATKIKGSAALSPKANYVTWFHEPDTAWFAYSIANEKVTKLNAHLKIKFADEENDVPDYPSPYGSAGWTADDKLFLVYDRYDIWAFDPLNQKEPVNLTKTGRSEKIVYRYVKMDPEERFIDPSKELLLSAFNETTKASGYYKLSLSDGKLTKLLMDSYRFGGTVKAKNANQLLLTRESFREFPDVWTSDINFKSIKKISDANPQMKEYLWGTVELVNWTSLDNIPLSGLLYKPEGFDPTKKYPMIVYFYEKESNNLHQHIKPEPLRSAINRATYVSNGYLVFVPDVVYKIGYPGESAYNAILPGVTSLISKGFVDEKNIGIQGHSWGGYQTAYIVTRTNLFKAAEAGAIVANMTSAYGGIRWESGLSRMFQYEHSQSRIGGTLWEKPVHYIENSPLFFAEKIQTPLLLLHNDADGAVPWYQGIEMYMALRRLNKPVWMLNYNGEPHWPVKRENRMDFQIRMMQFFNHYLKNDPAPLWLKEGVPAIEKGIVRGY